MKVKCKLTVIFLFGSWFLYKISHIFASSGRAEGRQTSICRINSPNYTYIGFIWVSANSLVVNKVWETSDVGERKTFFFLSWQSHLWVRTPLYVPHSFSLIWFVFFSAYQPQIFHAFPCWLFFSFIVIFLLRHPFHHSLTPLWTHLRLPRDQHMVQVASCI